jgi:hypothetical protein
VHPYANFRSGLGAATKWHETIQNMSFRLKVVDWACLLQKKQETVLEAQTHALNVPRYRFLQRVKCGYEMAWNHPKHELWTKIVDWACSLRQNKKWFWRHKLVHLMHPILIFTMGQVRQRSGVKPPETRVLDVKYVVRNQTDVAEQRNGVKIPKI